MKEKKIADIRVYKSNIPNVDGSALPANIYNKKLNIVLHRIVMKLRESDFSLGEFEKIFGACRSHSYRDAGVAWD